MGPESVPGRLEQAFGPAYLPLDAWKSEYNRCCGLLAGKNATSSIHGNVFPVASNSLDVVRGSCACVCCGSCFLFFSFFLFCQRVSPSPSLLLCWLFRCDVMRCQWCSSVVQGVWTGSWRDVPGAVIGKGFRSALLCTLYCISGNVPIKLLRYEGRRVDCCTPQRVESSIVVATLSSFFLPEEQWFYGLVLRRHRRDGNREIRRIANHE